VLLRIITSSPPRPPSSSRCCTTWHVHYTWPETRFNPHTALAAALRFHLANGLISLGGNFILMLVFV
jgi:hypothetical protein